MANEQEQSTLIRQYAHGELAAEALTSFEQQLKTDETLREELDLYLALRGSYQVAQKARFAALAAQQELVPEKPQARILSFDNATTRIMSIAAAVLLLATLAFLFWPKTDLSPQQMASAHLVTPYPVPPTVMGKESRDAQWREARLAYAQGQYNSVTTLLSALIEQGDSLPETAFYLGLSSLYQTPPNYDFSIQSFSTVEGLYREAADWYTALAHIQRGNSQAAIPFLERIRDPKRKAEADKLIKGILKNSDQR